MKLKDANRERLLAAARDQYAEHSGDNVEVDDDAEFSRSDRGVWVQAWVFVAVEDLS